MTDETTPALVQPAPVPPAVVVPEWVLEIKRKYLSQNISQFIIHGNVHDFVQVVRDGKPSYFTLRDFLNKEMFKYKDVVIYYDRAAGIKFVDDRIYGGESKMREDFLSTLEMFDELSNNSFANLSRDPAKSFFAIDTYFNLSLNPDFIRFLIKHIEKKLGKAGSNDKSSDGREDELIDRFIQRNLPDFDTRDGGASAGKLKKQIEALRQSLRQPKRIALVLEYAENLVPITDPASGRGTEQMLNIFLQKWAKDEKLLNADLTIILLAENISEVSPQYLRNPYTHDLNLPYPGEEDRLRFIQYFFEKHPNSSKFFEMRPEILAKNTAGLGLVHLNIILSEVTRNELLFTNAELTAKKKEMIETEAGGLLEFVESRFSLENVAGHAFAKKHLTDAARALKAGRPDVMPMGYLVSGPVGTGKTFMITAFANDIGVPMVMLKNFRGMYVGQSEGNLEKVLKILKAMSPVAVMIDEADAYLGSRSDDGGSGVNSRIFSMIASFMSNTDNRGKIIWFLVTARPDLMPVDFKRQGRAEEHIALFYPETIEEKKELLQIMLGKTDLKYINIDEFDEEFFEDIPIRSGADMEAALTRAKFKAASLGVEKVTIDIIAQVFNDFLPPTYPEEIELMNYAAVLECTSKELLPPSFREMTRGEVLERVEELKMKIRR
jgi:AAA+ superfamily predicted ATPase